MFDPMAAALACLPRNDGDTFHAVLRPTVPLARHMFRAPPQFHKTGVVFMVYLNCYQPHSR